MNIKKAIMAAIVGLLLAASPTQASDNTEQKEPSYWYCYQVGMLDGEAIFIITEIWSDTEPNHYALREEKFSEAVQKITKGKFKPEFDAQCLDYTDRKRAEKHVQRKIERSDQHDFRVMRIKFAFKIP